MRAECVRRNGNKEMNCDNIVSIEKYKGIEL
jgi:hypothetical protein